MSDGHQLVFLLDVDNTLLDNDAVTEDLRRHLIAVLGPESQQRYWDIFEELRVELGYADYLGALERLRVERMADPRLLQAVFFLADYPFRDRVYPGALGALGAIDALRSEAAAQTFSVLELEAKGPLDDIPLGSASAPVTICTTTAMPFVRT